MTNRAPAYTLGLSAAALVALIASESYTDKAIVPTKNDRPTVGFGSTFRDDGTPVQLGDTITPPKAIKRTYAHIQNSETKLKQCVTGELSQIEYDLLVDFGYQFGESTTCKSSMVKSINQGQYVQACNAYTKYKYSGGFDCSIPNNKVCAGVWTRQIERREKCLADQ